MMCVVTKDFVGAGENYVRDQLVDGGLFRNAQVLISQRFLRPATPDEIENATYEEEPAPAPAPKKKSGLKARMRKA